MRVLLLFIVCCIGLTNCVYYGDIHGHSRHFDACTLLQHHVYKPTTCPTCAGWWNRFNDPELNELISVAIADSPTIQIAKNRIERAEHFSDEAAATLWPTVSLDGSVEREKFSKFGLVPPPFNGKTFNIGMLGFNFKYELDFWGKNRQMLAAKISETCAAKAELAEAQLLISAAVANTYFLLTSNIEQAKIAKENWQLNEKILQIATDRAKHGIESDIPVKTIEANIQSEKLLLDEYNQAEKLSRHQLAVLLGDNPFTTEIETRPFSYHHYHVKIPKMISANILAMRPDIDAAKLRAEAAAHEIHVAKARFFPDINLALLFSYQSVGLGHLFDVQSQNNAITGAFDLPIFDAGARRANLGVKYAEYDMAVNQYNQTILIALRQVADQLSILHTVNSQLAAQNTAFNATLHNYKLFKSRYHHGIADTVQVLTSKQMLMQRQSTQLALQTRQLQATVALLKALGGNDFICKG